MFRTYRREFENVARGRATPRGDSIARDENMVRAMRSLTLCAPRVLGKISSSWCTGVTGRMLSIASKSVLFNEMRVHLVVSI